MILKNTLQVLSTAFILLTMSTDLFSHVNLIRAEAQNIRSYNHFSLYVIRFPSHWILGKSSRKDHLLLWNYPESRRILDETPLDLIRADIFLSQASLEESVRNFEPMEGKKVSVQDLELNGMKATRTFWSDLTFDFSYLIITTVQYSPNQTMSILSSYHLTDSATEDVILQVHNSFSKP